MKQLKQYLIFAFLAMSLVSCDKIKLPFQEEPDDPNTEKPQQEDPKPEDLPPGQIIGTVTLPEGADIAIEDYSIVGFGGAKELDKSGEFTAGTVDGENLQQTMFMTDENDNVLMLAYLNAGAEKVEMSPESSALGLFMMLSGIRTLRLEPEHWTQVEQKLKQEPEFAPFKAEVERLIREKADLLSTENEKLYELYNTLYLSLISKAELKAASQVTTRATGYDEDSSMPPLNVRHDGKKLVIDNANGRSPAYTVTIEEEDESGKLTQVYETSLGSASAWSFGIGSILVSVWNLVAWGDYELEGGISWTGDVADGEITYDLKPSVNYQITAHSGIAPTKEGGLKANTAMALNTYNLITAVFDGIGIPFVPSSECFKPAVEQAYKTVKFMYEAYQRGEWTGSDLKDIVNYSVDLFNNGDIKQCLNADDFDFQRVEKVSKKAAAFLVKHIETISKSIDIAGKVESAGALVYYSYNWLTKASPIKFCRSYNEANDTMDPCESIVTIVLKNRDMFFEFAVRTNTGNADNIWVDWNCNGEKDLMEDVNTQNSDGSFNFANGLFLGSGMTNLAIVHGAETITEFYVQSTQKNPVTDLFTAGCKNLMKLECTGANALSSISIKGSPYLKWLNVSDGNLDAKAIFSVISGLPQRKTEDDAVVDFTDNPATPTPENRKAGEDKNWTVLPSEGLFLMGTIHFFGGADEETAANFDEDKYHYSYQMYLRGSRGYLPDNFSKSTEQSDFFALKQDRNDPKKYVGKSDITFTTTVTVMGQKYTDRVHEVTEMEFKLDDIKDPKKFRVLKIKQTSDHEGRFEGDSQVYPHKYDAEVEFKDVPISVLKKNTEELELPASWMKSGNYVYNSAGGVGLIKGSDLSPYIIYATARDNDDYKRPFYKNVIISIAYVYAK